LPDQSAGSTVSRYLRKRWLKYVYYSQIYLLILPGLVYFAIFKLGPVWGLILAFQDFNPYLGVLGSKFVGLANFMDFFQSKYFFQMFRNTIVISMMNIVFFFPAPILLAIMLNEIRSDALKRLHQTLLYMPHFMSWVVITGLTFFLLSIDIGLVNKVITHFNGDTVAFLSNPNLFWWIILFQNLWKEVGWGTILFLAAISQIDPSLYEAAIIDGASRLQQITRITLPSILPTIVVLFILRMGRIMDVGFEQILLMSSPFVKQVAEIFDTYAYTQGLVQGNFSVGVTVGICKSMIGVAMVLLSNKMIKRLGHEGIY
jgi:putative aldouronate transport system permease protein